MKNIDILDKGDSLITQMLLNGNLSIDDVLTLFHNQHKWILARKCFNVLLFIPHGK